MNGCYASGCSCWRRAQRSPCAYGAYELAKCVVEGIRSNRLPLAGLLAEDVPAAFDPGKPAPPDAWAVPPSPPRPNAAIATPAGS